MIIIRKISAAFLICIVISLPAVAYGQTAVSVLCYHAFLDKKKDTFCFSLDELNSHIMQLRKEGFKFVSVNDIVSGRIDGAKNILLTVDDGNRSVYEAYKKVLRPNGIRPLLSIYPNIIGKQKYALTWEQLSELVNDGCDIAAHGYFHLKVNRRLFDKNPGYFKMEIYESKKVLEEKLNRKISIFVYPFGLWSDITINALKDAGYRYAFTIDKGRIDIPLLRGDGNYHLPRYMVTRTSWKYCFNSVIRNARSKAPVKVARSADEDNEQHAGMGFGRPETDSPPVLNSRSVRRDIRTMKPAVKRSVQIKEISVARKEESKTNRQRSEIVLDDSLHRRVKGDQDFSPAVALVGKDKPNPMESSLINIPSGVFEHPTKQARLHAALEAKVGRDLTVYRTDIKKTYNRLTHESYKTYNNYLGMVRGKIDRIKNLVKQYVMSHF